MPHGVASGAGERATWGALAALTLLALALHCVGLDWHLPHYPQGDEKILWLQLQVARGETVTPEEAQLARCYPRLLGLAAHALVGVAPVPEDPSLETLRASVAHDVLGIRRIIAAFSALMVPLTWLLARPLVGARWALLAAFLAGTSTLAVWYSSMGRPHAVVTTLAVACVAASLRARSTGRFGDFVLAGGLAALALGTLHSGACAFAAVAAAWWWCARPRWGAPFLGLCTAAALCLASFALLLRGEGLPDLEQGATLADRLLSFLGMGAHQVDAGFFDGGGFARLARALRDYEPVLTVLAAAGLAALAVAAIRGRSGAEPWVPLLVVGAHPLAHVLVFGLYSNSFQRFWLPLVPYLAVLASLAVARVASARPSLPQRVALAGAVVLVLAQAAIAVKIAVLRTRDDTQELVARWIEEHPERGPFRIDPTVQLPLVPRDAAFRAEFVSARMYFVPWQAATLSLDAATRARLGQDLRELPLLSPEARAEFARDPAAWVDALGTGSVVLERHRDGRRRVLRAVRDELVRRAPPLAVFDPLPARDAWSRPIEYMLDGPHAPEAWFVWRVVRAARLGPELEILGH
ncbi:MAG: glycosyltransferase family 39 protein [Planctomycetes bacterium]|nr:glycosyltransferase family 39 protein [Planctomycetota bacterium]